MIIISKSSTTPILLYIDPTCAEDPTFHLKQLADVQGIASTKVKYMALGADNGLVATDLLDTAFIRGQVNLIKSENSLTIASLPFSFSGSFFKTSNSYPMSL